jgi:hypothetical protein
MLTEKRLTGSKRGARPLLVAALLAATLAAGCGLTTPSGADAGCEVYGSQRLSMPRPLDTSPLASWVADLDDGMTGACR